MSQTNQYDELNDESGAEGGVSESDAGPELEADAVADSPAADPEVEAEAAADPPAADPVSPEHATGGNGDGGPPADESASVSSALIETDMSVEELVTDLERVTVERDQYLEASRRIQAEFENYRKQVSKRESEARQRANEGLIGEMLPVLDAFDSALSSGVDELAPMRTALLDALSKQGLERIDPGDADFDPNLHEAVMHEEGDGESGPVVAEVMRAGYSWKGRVIRPAMVRVRG